MRKPFLQLFSRRKFLKSLTLAMGSTGLVSGSLWANVVVPKQKARLGVALVGLGYYSTDLLAPALRRTKNCELRGIVTGSPWKIPVWQERYGIPDKNVYNYQNMHEVANNGDIDIIYIVLPTGLHSEYGVIGANAGKHVWCEKPMARTAQECEALIAACKSSKVYLSIGYRMQHEPNTQTLVKWAKSKPYGKITGVKAEAGYYDSRSDHWKQNKALGGGAMYDMGVYPLNAARYATGEEPSSVSAVQSTKRPRIYHEVDETMHFSLNFPSGATARCATSLGMGMNDLRVECANGWYGLSPFQSYGGIHGETSDGKSLNQQVPNQQARQMDDDALAIITKSDVMVPGEEGKKDIRIVEAIYKAARTGKTIDLT